MNDTRTILCGNIVAKDYPKCAVGHFNELILAVLSHKHLVRIALRIFSDKCWCVVVDLCAWLHPRHELCETQSLKVGTLISANNLVRHKLLSLLVRWQWLVVGEKAFW